MFHTPPHKVVPAVRIPVSAVRRELSHANAIAWLAGRWEPAPRENAATRARLAQAWLWAPAYSRDPYRAV